jgi:hypothetical protein
VPRVKKLRRGLLTFRRGITFTLGKPFLFKSSNATGNKIPQANQKAHVTRLFVGDLVATARAKIVLNLVSMELARHARRDTRDMLAPSACTFLIPRLIQVDFVCFKNILFHFNFCSFG